MSLEQSGGDEIDEVLDIDVELRIRDPALAARVGRLVRRTANLRAGPADGAIVVTDGLAGWAEGDSVVVLAEQRHLAAVLSRRPAAALPRTATGAQLLAAIAAVRLGLTVAPARLGDRSQMDRLVDRLGRAAFGAAARADGAPQVLSSRERQVLGLLADGASNKEIARRLGISIHTAKFHVASIIAKLGAAGRTDAVTRGLRLGFVII